MATIIETENLVTNFYTYEGVVKALNQVNIVVNHGETFGLVGESGCGKSVTVRSMMRIVQEPGKIEGGKVVLYLDEEKEKQAVNLLEQSEAYMEKLRGDQISMIFQEPNLALNPIMTIGEQISESLLFHRKDELMKEVNAYIKSPEYKSIFPMKKRLLKKLVLSKVIDLLKRLHIPYSEQVVNSYPHNLSGGMKQRIVIAIALACHPELLIADEATSNLDVTIQAQILELLCELKETDISSILLITHDLGVVAETCDRVGVMYAGDVAEIANADDIFFNPKHPYTVALLDSVPKVEQVDELQTIEGNVPNLVAPPSGCRFHPRCKHVMDVCKTTKPPMIDIGENHQVACYLYK